MTHPPRSPQTAVVLSLLALAGPLALGGQPALVRDLNPATQVDAWPYLPPHQLAVLGGLAIYPGYDGVHGIEPWVSDGTTVGTRLLADLCPGACSSEPEDLTPVGDTLLFSADDGVHGRELWATDGTAAGTHLVADLLPGLRGSDPRELVAVSSRLFFSAELPAHGREPWASDGTTAGTVSLGDLHPGAASSRPLALGQVGARLLFAAADPVLGTELWASDGTMAGTALLLDITPGSASGLSNLSDVDVHAPRAALGPDGKLYFRASDAAHGSEPWASDGTAAGTALLADLEPGPGSSAPSWFTGFASGLLFAATTSAAGNELWKTDGTPTGTALVRDLVAGPDSGFLRALVAAGNRAFLVGQDVEASGLVLWTTDGSAAGTLALRSFADSSAANLDLLGLPWLAPLGERVVFFADGGTGHGFEPWVSDGTLPGTVQLADIAPGTASSLRVQGFESQQREDRTLALGSSLLFRAWSPDHGLELWRTDGTPAGTTELADANTQASGAGLQPRPFFLTSRRLALPAPPTAAGGLLFLQGTDGSAARQLWVSDGSSAGTMALEALVDASGAALTTAMAAAGAELVFARTTPAAGLEPWTSDGTPGGTRLLADLLPGPLGSEPNRFTSFGERAYFHASDPGSGSPPLLWSTDGASPTPQPVGQGELLHAVVTGQHLWGFLGASLDQPGLWRLDRAEQQLLIEPAKGTSFTYPRPLGFTGNRLFASAQDANHGRELWIVEDPVVGAVRLTDLQPGPASGLQDGLLFDPAEAAVLGNRLYFPADDGTSGIELWASDGTAAGTQRVADLFPGPRGSDPRQLVATDSHLFWVAEDGAHGREVWTLPIGGTPALLVDTLPGPGSSVPQELATHDGQLWWSAWTPALGREAYTSNGSTAGTQLVADLAPGPASASPMAFTSAGGNLFFVANDGTTGFEPWALPRAGVFANGFETGDLSRWDGLVGGE